MIDRVNGNYEEDPLLTTLSKDPGDETQKRFRYQHTFTVLISIQMFAGKIPYKELYCEHHEDILAVREDGKYDGLQIKTRQVTDGLFELRDAAIKKSLLRFIKLESDFVNSFSNFMIISNCPFREDDSAKSLINLVKQVSNIPLISDIKPRDLQTYIHELVEESGLSLDVVLSTIKKIKVLVGPGLDDIDAKIINDHLGKINQCIGASIEKLRIIHRRLCEKVYFASSRFLENGVYDYAALASGQVNTVAEEINAKRITKLAVEKIVQENFSKNLFLNARSDATDIIKAKSNHLLKRKMSSGFIDYEEIEIMDDLRTDAEDYFLTNSFKAENRQEYLSEIQQIKKIVLNQSVEAKSRCKKEGAPYGTEMLHSVEDRLREVSTNRSKDVFGCPYEILKGLVGVLTNECKVAFSKEPPGGWLNNVDISN
ncbi:dsDNA nuclease domain-containing protein [Paenibacillus sp. GCM10012306]|uniref:dsDNA nuclease domain-containing protein n=1 Tax=Paenibacillus sp. GCM10012306 TaxID=3317342 RepID=UPI0036245B22